jgi:hypothetical protein
MTLGSMGYSSRQRQVVFCKILALFGMVKIHEQKQNFILMNLFAGLKKTFLVVAR